jgi:hypothetical protein
MSEAFGRTEKAAALAQSACLLILGLQLRGENAQDKDEDKLPTKDLSSLGVPEVKMAGGRVDSQQIRRSLSLRFGTSAAIGGPVVEDVTLRPEIFYDLAQDYLREPDSYKALALLEASLRHPHELVRTSAAAAYHPHSSESDRLSSILEQGTYSADPLTRKLSAMALTQMNPRHSRLRELTTRSGRAAGASSAASHTALLIHGTFALSASWWQPGGDFHTYLLKNIRPDLYQKNDRFAWSGGYWDQDRADASDQLLTWVNSRSEQGLSLFAHSHGGSVAMICSQGGLRIGELVLLSCPVHYAKYKPDFTQIGRVVSIRVHLDLIILLDRGGQRFKDSRISENVLPIWFDHTKTHSPEVWQNSTYNIPSMV